MSVTWEHPELGKFEYDERGDYWSKTIEVPAFGVFVYDSGGGTAPLTYELVINAEDKSDAPSENAIALIRKVLADQDKLAKAVTSALWEDLNGRGPHSGMWWHGDIATLVEEGMEDDLPPLADSDGLRAWMRMSRITIHKQARRYDRPVVELGFEAAFELEHGVGILTDGDVILGTGYSGDVGAFK